MKNRLELKAAALLEKIEQLVVEQVAAIVNHDAFLELEGTWRGLAYLVSNTDQSDSLRIVVFNASQEELRNDLVRVEDPSQSSFAGKLARVDLANGSHAPLGVLLGAYYFENQDVDVEMLDRIAIVCSTNLTPFIAGVSPRFAGLGDWSELKNLREGRELCQGTEFNRWNELRDEVHARFLVLCMPRTLAQAPFDVTDAFAVQGDSRDLIPKSQEEKWDAARVHMCWMNTSFALGVRLTTSFTETGWPTRVFGMAGGQIDGIPLQTCVDDSGQTVLNCPAEIAITDHRHHVLIKSGLCPLGYFPESQSAVFGCLSSCYRPRKFNTANETAADAQRAQLLPTLFECRLTRILEQFVAQELTKPMSARKAGRILKEWFKQLSSSKRRNEWTTEPFRRGEGGVQIKGSKLQGYKVVADLYPWNYSVLSISVHIEVELPRSLSESWKANL